MLSKASATTFVSLLALVPFVVGHGYVSKFAIDDTWYDGNTPTQFKDPVVPSAVRQIALQDPVKLYGNPNDFQCGINAQKAPMTVDAMPGSKVSVYWYDKTQTWPHNVGPLMTYMTSCGDTPCDQFDPTNAQWFKIDQKGLKDNSSNTWWQDDLMNNWAAGVTIPENLAPGGYLLRHEIIALHIATTAGPEFYPSCMQLNIGGNGDGHPDTFVTFPDAYPQGDPSLFGNVFNLKAPSDYKFPAGPVANIVSSSNNRRDSERQDGRPSNYFSWRNSRGLGLH